METPDDFYAMKPPRKKIPFGKLIIAGLAVSLGLFVANLFSSDNCYKTLTIARAFFGDNKAKISMELIRKNPFNGKVANFAISDSEILVLKDDILTDALINNPSIGEDGLKVIRNFFKISKYKDEDLPDLYDKLVSATLRSGGDNTYYGATYNRSENNITMYNEVTEKDYYMLKMLHELLHLCGSIPGNTCLDEGMVSLLVADLWNDGDNVSYKDAFKAVVMIRGIVGPDAMLEAFCKRDISPIRENLIEIIGDVKKTDELLSLANSYHRLSEKIRKAKLDGKDVENLEMELADINEKLDTGYGKYCYKDMYERKEYYDQDGNYSVQSVLVGEELRHMPWEARFYKGDNVYEKGVLATRPRESDINKIARTMGTDSEEIHAMLNKISENIVVAYNADSGNFVLKNFDSDDEKDVLFVSPLVLEYTVAIKKEEVSLEDFRFVSDNLDAISAITDKGEALTGIDSVFSK